MAASSVGISEANWLRTANSLSFCFEKDIHCLTIFGRLSSLFSWARSYGVCKNEQELAIQTLSLPKYCWALSINLREASKLFLQIFLPSTTPKESICSPVYNVDSKMSSNCNGHLTRSKCNACTGSCSAVSKLSP